jgi:hypothetical protein
VAEGQRELEGERKQRQPPAPFPLAANPTHLHQRPRVRLLNVL